MWNPESALKKVWNPESRILESGIQRLGIWNPALGIRNPPYDWIPLHGAIESLRGSLFSRQESQTREPLLAGNRQTIAIILNK